jgi:hypothetical protein
MVSLFDETGATFSRQIRKSLLKTKKERQLEHWLAVRLIIYHSKTTQFRSQAVLAGLYLIGSIA